MQFFRSLVFNILFYSSLIVIFVIAIPTLILPNKFTLYFGKILAYITVFLIKSILGRKVTFSGIENLNKYEKFFVASAHHSLLETFILQAPLQYPIFVLKKELLKIPLFGWYLKKIGSIDIIRDTTTKENLNFFEKIKVQVDKNKRPLLIFPQGTRVKFGEKLPFKKGAGRIYDQLKIKCQPLAINSGSVWPKKGKMKPNKNLTISILKPIESGLNKDIFLKKLQDNIYFELDILN